MIHEQPILSSLELAGEGFEPVGLPPLFLEAERWMAADSNGQIDVAVMPKVGRAACWFALSLSLALARRGFESRSNGHSLSLFNKGDLVAVLPARDVYRFEGIYRSYNLVKLALINDRGNGTFSLPLSQLSRLQHSQKATPRGRKVPSACDLSLTPLDWIIETTSFGNADFFDTEAIYLGNRARFQNAMSILDVGRNVDGKYHTFATAELLPWGRVTSDGNVRPEGDDTGMARPLVARANSAANIIDFLDSNDTDCRHIVVDDVRVLERELHSLCRLIDDFGCRVIGFCGFKDFRELQQLEATGRIRARQIRPDLLSRAEGDGIFRLIASSARRAVKFEWIEVFEVKNTPIDQCAVDLELAAQAVQSGETDLDERGLLGRAFGLLRRLANPRLDGAIDEGAATAIDALSADFSRHANFWPNMARKHFEDCIGRLRTLQTSSEDVAKVKRDAVEGLLMRALTTKELAREDVGFFDLEDEALVLSGWPRRAKVQERVFEYDHDCVFAVAFEFEARWFRQFNKSYRDAELYASDEDSPYRPTRGNAEARRHWQARPGEVPNSPEVDRQDFRRRLVSKGDAAGETCLPAKLIWFADGRVCAGSEGHRFPTLRSLGRYRGEATIDIRMITSPDLESGDLCAFRSDSDDDLVRSFARSAMGELQYEKTRELAESWRSALRSYIEDKRVWIPELQEKLRAHGLKRTQAAIRNWLFGPAIIGPSSKEDLAVIARAMEASVLERDLDRVWAAIGAIRSSHQSAGIGISALLREELVEFLEHRETLTGHYSLSLGEIDVVEVDELDPEIIEVPSGLVNRLLPPERLSV